MPKLHFTVRALDALPTPDKGRIEYWDESTSGSFGLRVSSTGQRTWVAMYRAGQRLRRFTIGDYERLPLADARSLAKDVLYRASKGEDPAQEKVRIRKAETFREVADAYVEGWAIGPGGKENPRKRSWEQDQKLLNWYVLPEWGSLKACEIKREDVKALLRKQVNRGAPIVANRVLALVRKVFNYALEEEIGTLEYNPCQAVRPAVDEKSRQGQRVLSFEEIRKFWDATELTRHREAAAILKLRLLSLQRGIELRLMHWQELDLETGWWTIPGSRTKNKLDHRVPITPEMWDVISAFEINRHSSKYVFASPVTQGGAILNLKDPFRKIREASGIVVPFVMRDLRRTATSHMTGQIGVPRFTVGKILNHVEPGVTKVYDRHGYDAEKRQALTAWCTFMGQILNGEIAGRQVLTFRAV